MTWHVMFNLVRGVVLAFDVMIGAWCASILLMLMQLIVLLLELRPILKPINQTNGLTDLIDPCGSKQSTARHTHALIIQVGGLMDHIDP